MGFTCIILFNPCISPNFTCWKPHSKWYSSSLGRLTLKAPLPAIGRACGLLPYSRLSSLGTSAAAPAWARHPTAAGPSGNAAAPASRSLGDRPWQWFPTKSSSHGSNNIQTFRFLKQTKSSSPTSASHNRGQVQISERKTTMKHNMCSVKQKDEKDLNAACFSAWSLHHLYLFGNYRGFQCCDFPEVPKSPPVTQTMKIFPNSLR